MAPPGAAAAAQQRRQPGSAAGPGPIGSSLQLSAEQRRRRALYLQHGGHAAPSQAGADQERPSAGKSSEPAGTRPASSANGTLAEAQAGAGHAPAQGQPRLTGAAAAAAATAVVHVAAAAAAEAEGFALRRLQDAAVAEWIRRELQVTAMGMLAAHLSLRTAPLRGQPHAVNAACTFRAPLKMTHGVARCSMHLQAYTQRRTLGCVVVLPRSGIAMHELGSTRAVISCASKVVCSLACGCLHRRCCCSRTWSS